MNISKAQPKLNPVTFVSNIHITPALVFMVILLTALVSFEIFNFSTTDYALRDLLGELSFAQIRWATILAVAFCGIDFAGVALLLTQAQAGEEPKETWYLFGAWLLGATMNAMLTWWGVSIAIATHSTQSASVFDGDMLKNIVPVFVAIMVWVIRILIIGTLVKSREGEDLPSARAKKTPASGAQLRRLVVPSRTARAKATAHSAPTLTAIEARPARPEKPAAAGGNRTTRPARPTAPAAPRTERPEPTYHNLNAARTSAMNSRTSTGFSNRPQL